MFDTVAACDQPLSLELALLAGGDARLTLDPVTGLNRYGCGPSPCPERQTFASSTASTISPAGYDAARALWERLGGCAAPEAAYAAGAEHLRLRLAALCGLAPEMAGRIALSPSGTDAHALAAAEARARATAPLSIILPDPCETGRGVPAALAAAGVVRSVRLREADGRPRAVDAEVEALCAEAMAGGGRALLCLLDVSKTGLIAPSAECAQRLQQRFGETLTVLVDACQFRLGADSLRAYLDRGFLVALTGSKFLGGPAFSGALLRPIAAATPESETPNLGLLLRWEAALCELTAFRALRDADIAGLLDAFGGAVEAAIDATPGLQRLTAPPLRRFAPHPWDQRRTIFSFVPVRDGAPLSAEATQALFERLPPATLGQPVTVGQVGEAPISALRVALGARQITAALNTPGGRDSLIAAAVETLARTARQIGR